MITPTHPRISQEGRFFTPVLPQPPVTSHLAGAPEGAEMPGVNPQVGNYATAVTDAQVTVAGPALQTVRTYNSQDLRTSGAFGAGWSTPWDERLDLDDDSSGNVVATLATGRQIRFGQNPDGSFSPPVGENLTLVKVQSPDSWTLRDTSGLRRSFDSLGRLVRVADADGRTQSYTYGATNLAAGSSATGSASCTGSQGPDKAVNASVSGGVDDKWCSDTGPRFLQTDLGSAQTISSVVLRHAQAGGEAAALNTRDFTVQTSTDGGTWSTVATVTGNTAAVTTHTFTPTLARYVKVNVTTATQGSDTAARIYEFEVYGGDRLTTVADAASGRALHVTWSGRHIATVSTDAPAVGQPASTWTYTYTGDALTKVCTALGATACTSYTYVASSHYRSAVLDDNPSAYWPLGETSGTVAVNAAARTVGEFDATTSGVTWGAAGALAGSPDTAATFTGATPSQVNAPVDLTSRSMMVAVELWFKAASGASGVLYSEQSVAPPAVPGQDWTPNLYVGTDGKLRGQYWTLTGGVTPVTTGAVVTDGLWHHTVLSGSVDHQELYLDGVQVGSITGRTIAHNPMRYATVGNGYTNLWPAGSSGNLPFSGQIDDVAVYRHSLGATQVAAHYAARTTTTRLSTVVEPGGVAPAVSLTYQHATGRVTTLADRHGATWTLSAPTLTATQRQVTVSSTARTPITYAYDPLHGGRMVSRTDTFGTKTWGYSDLTGFVASVADENGNATRYDTDPRGNVTTKTTTRSTGVENTEYFGYYLDTQDLLDPRNDMQLWSSDARSADVNDLTYRTTRTLDAAGHVTAISYPKPAGQSTNPTETSTYTAPYTATTSTGSFLPADDTVLPMNYASAVVYTALPFPVTFYGQSQSDIWVSADGFVTFSEPVDWPLPFTQSAPDPMEPNQVLMPFMDHLFADSAASIRTATLGSAPNRKFVVEWRNVHAYDDSGSRLSFEIVLSETGGVDFRYTGVDPANSRERGDHATIGVENEAGTSAVVYSHNEPAVSDGLVIAWTPSATTVPAGLPLSTTGKNGGVTTNTYNAGGDLTGTTDPVGLVTTTTYDGLGRKASETMSATIAGAPVTYGTTAYTYNPLSEPLTVTSPAVHNPISNVWHTPLTTYTYDTAGHKLSESISDTTGGDVTRTTTWGYDPAGRLITTTAPDATVTSQTWSAAGDIATTTAPGGLVLNYGYDDAHRLTTTTATGTNVDPTNPAATSLRLETRAYDPAGLPASVSDAMGRTTTYSYYLDNLLDTTSHTRPLAGLAPLAVEKRSYDRAGHPTSVVTAGGTITTSYVYDPAGNVTTQTLDPAGLNRTTATTYNPDSTAHHTAASVGGTGCSASLSLRMVASFMVGPG